MPISSPVFSDVLSPGLREIWEREYACDWEAVTGVSPDLASSAASALTAAHVQRAVNQLRNQRVDNVRLQRPSNFRPGQIFWTDELTDNNNWFLMNENGVQPVAASAIYPEPVPAHLSQPELVYPGEEQ